MASRQQLEDALIAAHDKGDTEAAQIFADEIRALGDTGPAADISTDSWTNKALRGARAGVAEIGTAGEAITEGAQRLIEGTGELASTVAQAPFDLYDKVRSPNISELVTGKQKSANILGDYQDAVQSGRDERKATYEKAYGREYPEFLTKASELGLGLATGSTETKAVNTVWKAIKAGAKAGAVQSAFTYSGDREVGDKIKTTLVGGALGGAVGTVPGVAGAAKNAIRRYLTADAVPAAEQAAARTQQAFPSLEGELTVSQQTGNVKTQQLESTVASRKAQEQWLRQQEKLVNELKDLATKYGPDMPAEEVVKRGGQAIANASRKLTLTRKAIWGSDLDAIRTKLAADATGVPGATGGNQLVELPGFQDRVKKILDDFRVGPEALGPKVQKILETHAEHGGAIPFDDLDYLLRQLNEKNFSVLTGTGNARAEAVAAKRLRQAVSESLDEIPESSEIGALLKQARATYAQHSAAIKEVNTSAAAQVLGVDKNGYAQMVQNPEAAMDQLLKLTPSQQRQAMGVLKTADPELVASLRGSNIRSAMQEATEVTGAGTPSFNIQKFLKATVGGGELRAAGLYTPADGDVLKGNLESLNSLINRAGYKAQATPPTDLAMTAGGMAVGAGSTPFAIRILGRIMGGFGAEKVLFDPKARKEFLILKDSFGTKSAAAAAAAGRLEAMMSDAMRAEDPVDE
jgi:hypothetical protein